MNYIHKLQAENAALKAQLHALQGGIIDLRAHLASAKFRVDTTIQVGDVHAWLDRANVIAQEAHDHV